jgi:NO-binding membrane sensor protein with MHYT domain
MGSLAMGGTAIWVMHFIAMLGFTVPGAEIRYDPLLTVASLCVAVAIAALGLTLAVVRDGKTGALLLAGFITGSGAAGMHYLGMAALHMAPRMHYDVRVIAASEVIAVLGATAALWFALRVRGLPATIGAAVIMGVAVTAMHYTGMAALHLTAVAAATDPTGAMAGMPISAQAIPAGMSASELLTPIVLGISVTTTILLLVVAMAPTERELSEEQRIAGLAQALRERSS